MANWLTWTLTGIAAYTLLTILYIALGKAAAKELPDMGREPRLSQAPGTWSGSPAHGAAGLEPSRPSKTKDDPA